MLPARGRSRVMLGQVPDGVARAVTTARSSERRSCGVVACGGRNGRRVLSALLVKTVGADRPNVGPVTSSVERRGDLHDRSIHCRSLHRRGSIVAGRHRIFLGSR